MPVQTLDCSCNPWNLTLVSSLVAKATKIGNCQSHTLMQGPTNLELSNRLCVCSCVLGGRMLVWLFCSVTLKFFFLTTLQTTACKHPSCVSRPGLLPQISTSSQEVPSLFIVSQNTKASNYRGCAHSQSILRKVEPQHSPSVANF